MAAKTKRKKRGINFVLNKAVKRFKKGDTKYFDLIYKICVRRLEIIAYGMNFNGLKYNKDDFVQDGIIYILNNVIKKYRRSRSKFTTFLYMRERNFRTDFIKINKRKEVLCGDLFDPETVNSYLKSRNDKVSHHYKHSINFDSKIVMKEYIKGLYLILDNHERKLFKKLYDNRYRNDDWKVRAKLGRKCGFKKSRSEYLIKNMRTKFKDKVLNNGEEKR